MRDRTRYAKPTGLGFRWNRTEVALPNGQRIHVIVERDGKRWLLTICEWQERHYFGTMRGAQMAVEELKNGVLVDA